MLGPVILSSQYLHYVLSVRDDRGGSGTADRAGSPFIFFRDGGSGREPIYFFQGRRIGLKAH